MAKLGDTLGRLARLDLLAAIQRPLLALPYGRIVQQLLAVSAVFPLCADFRQ